MQTTVKEFEDNETLQPSASAPIDSVIKEESLLYAQKCGRHGSRGGESKPKFDDFDWGNSKGRDGVCFHCRRSGHIAGKCVADMPTGAKERVLNHHAHIVKEDVFNLTIAQLPADDPLILALGEGHQAHAAIENGPHIFSVSEDVPEEFRTVNGYISNDY
jgi:hypothetical protein